SSLLFYNLGYLPLTHKCYPVTFHSGPVPEYVAKERKLCIFLIMLSIFWRDLISSDHTDKACTPRINTGFFPKFLEYTVFTFSFIQLYRPIPAYSSTQKCPASLREVLVLFRYSISITCPRQERVKQL